MSADMGSETKPKSKRTAGVGDAAVITTAKGSGILVGGKLIETAGRFIVAIMLARLLGADQFGQYTLALATSALVASIGKLGMDSALVRFIAVFRGNEDDAGVWGIIQVAAVFALITSILLGLALYLLAGVVANRIYHEPQLEALLRVGAIMVPVAVMNDILIGASRGFKRMHFSVIAQDTIHLIVRLVLISILALVGLNSFWAIATYGIADVVSIIVLLYLLNGIFPWRSPHAAHRDVRGVLSFAVPLFLSEMLKRFRGDIQTILLGATYSVASVGVFTVAEKINIVSRISSFSLMTSAEPAFAELHAKKDQPQMARLYTATSRWMFALNFPVILITILFAKPLLGIFGESFVSGAPALIVLSLATLVNISTGLGGTVIEMAGYTKLKLFNAIGQLALFVLTSILFIPRWGVMGAAGAALVSSAIIQIARMLQAWILLRLLPYDGWFARTVAAATVTTVVAFVTRWQFATDAGLVSVAIHTVLILILYGITLLLFGLAPQDRLIVERLVTRGRSFLVAHGPMRKRLAGTGD